MQKKTTKKNNLKKKKKIKFNVPVQFDSAKQNKTERERERERLDVVAQKCKWYSFEGQRRD